MVVSELGKKNIRNKRVERESLGSLFKISDFLNYAFIYMRVCAHVSITGQVWWSEDKLQEPVSSRNQMKVLRLGGKCLYPLSHVTSPLSDF